MIKDYRNSKYCPKLENLREKKDNVVKQIRKDHSRSEKIYEFLHDNSDIYKMMFIEAYNHKCCYCGVSLDINDYKLFEIDHFIHEKSVRFNGDESKADYIENLVLACFECNRSKQDLELPDKDLCKICPDSPFICYVFIRDENYYIRINENFKNDESVKKFYEKLKLGSQIHRLDYLLLNIFGLRNKFKENDAIYKNLNEAFELLKKRRR